MLDGTSTIRSKVSDKSAQSSVRDTGLETTCHNSGSIADKVRVVLEIGHLGSSAHSIHSRKLSPCGSNSGYLRAIAIMLAEVGYKPTKSAVAKGPAKNM